MRTIEEIARDVVDAWDRWRHDKACIGDIFDAIVELHAALADKEQEQPK